MLGGLHGSDLIVVAARPGMGKTALMCNLVDVCDNSVGIMSAEQPAEQISARLLTLRANVPFERWRRGKLADSAAGF